MRSSRFANKRVAASRLAAILVLLGAGATTGARADDAEFHPLDSVLKGLDLKTDVGQPADFVEKSRPKTEGDYLPVGAPHPERSVKVKSPAELKAAEAELEAARLHHDQISGRKPTALKSAKPKAPAQAAPKMQTQN